MFTVILHKRAEKDMHSMDRRIWRDTLREEVFALSIDFMKGKRLNGVFEGCRSKRVGDYRVLYRVFFDEGIIEVLSIKHRKDVYKQG